MKILDEYSNLTIKILDEYTRSEWIRLLTSYGAACTMQISAKTTHLLVGPNLKAGWKTLQAQTMNIKVINEIEAFDLIRTSQPTALLSSIQEEEHQCCSELQ